MINLITGKAGSGKTITIYDILASKAKENNIIITNPQSIDAYELFLARNHVAATVISINDAPGKISELIGYTYKKTASTIDEITIIADIIRNSNNLSLIKTEHSHTGVVDKLLNAITDIKREGVSSEDFAAWVEKAQYGGLIGMKLSDISYIMEEYNKKLAENELVTSDDLSWDISNYIEENGIILCDNLFIDTLPGYLNININFICSLLGSAPNVYAAFRLTDSKSHDYFAFSDSMKALSAVKEYAEAHGYDIKNVKASRKTSKTAVKNLSSGIDIISENFFDRNTKVTSNDDSVMLYEASTAPKEVEFVCSEISKIIADKNSYDDVTVASPLIEDYYPIIQQMFNDHDIPFHYFKTDNLANTQLFNMVNVLLEATYDGVTLPRIMQAIQINFLQLPDSDCAIMDSFNKRFGDDKAIALANCKKYAPADYAQVTNIIANIEENFSFFSEGIAECKIVKDYLRVIVDTLVIYNANESLYSDITKLHSGNEYQMCNDVVNIWNSLIDVVNSIAKISGNEEMTVEEFAKFFEKVCQNKKLVNNNKYFGEVKVVSLPDVPNNRSKYLFVLGCNEGNLVNLPDETFFAPNEKHLINDDLNIEIPENDYFISKKIADIYSAFTTPYNRLIISWPVFTTDYNPVVRASVIDSIYSIFKENIIHEDEYFKTIGEADYLETLCKISACYSSGVEISKELSKKIESYSKHPMFKDRLSAALHNMTVSKDRINTTKGIVDRDFDLSVTKAEKYNECPFKYFVASNLSPREQKMFIETPANKGTFYHSVFCKFYTYLKENSIDYTRLARDKVRFNNIIDKIIEEVKSDHNENVLNSSAKMRFVSLKMIETIKVSVWNSLKQIASGDFRPEKMEYDIGKTSSLSFTLDNGHNVTVTGVADRIDVFENTDGAFARIIDYKSGNVSFSKEKFEKGTQLQLPLYMSALNHKYKFGGMYYFHVHNPYSDSENETNEVKEFKLSGPTSSESNIPESSDHALTNTGTAINSEIINVSKTLKGEFGKRSDLISENEAKEMFAAAQEKFLNAAEGICSGNSIAAPAKTKTSSPCTYCPYKSMCGKSSI